MEQFIIEFSRDGEPRIAAVVYDAVSGTYKHVPVARESERAERLLASPAQTLIKSARENGSREEALRKVVADWDRRRSKLWGRFLLWLIRKTT